jgi:hypothetical protein
VVGAVLKPDPDQSAARFQIFREAINALKKLGFRRNNAGK